MTEIRQGADAELELVQPGKAVGNRLFDQKSRASLRGSKRHLKVQGGWV